MILDSLREQWASCTACALRATCRGVVFGEAYSQGDVSLAPLILIIGEAPGKAEDDSGEPFTGAAGQLLRQILVSADLRLGFMTNAVGCRPIARDPSPAELQACSARVEQIAEIVQPAGLLFVGKLAEEAFSGATWAKGLPQVGIAHPSTLLNQGHPTSKTGKIILAQVSKIRRLLFRASKGRGDCEGPPAPVEVHEHDFKQIGSWVGSTTEPILSCGCGEFR